MPYSRQRPRIAPTGRVTIRLNTVQRDLFTGADATPKSLMHTLRRAPVREGQLSVRVDRETLDALIAIAAKAHASDRKAERELDALLSYLESLADRFAEPEENENVEDPKD